MTVRVRYAPSPTGEPHVGNIRTALFDWFMARHHGGRFILRIEDTDQSRLVPGALEAIYEALRWLGLDWDEGPDVGGQHAPYVQSQRLDLYRQAAGRLVDGGHAYECFCSPDRLEAVRREQQARKQPPRYDGLCRRLAPAARQARASSGEQHVIRFAMPESGETVLTDEIRGEIVFQNELMGDFVLLKSDGFPTYHLASVVDDHAMEISHVLRAEEWISSSPGHLQLYEAFGWEPPRFAHLPLIIGKDKSKLSKRHGATSVLWYRDQGYLPEAMLNFLGLLGWSLDDTTTVISRQQFIEHFTLDRVVRNPAIWDTEKLDWLNGHYLRALGSEEFARRVFEWLDRALPEGARERLTMDYVRAIAPLIQERIKLLSEAVAMTAFFFVDRLDYDRAPLLGKRFREDEAGAEAALERAAEAVRAVQAWQREEIEAAFRALAEQMELKPRDLFGLLRVAVTGSDVSPPLFESMEVLGRERVLDRIMSSTRLLSEPRSSLGTA